MMTQNKLEIRYFVNGDQSFNSYEEASLFIENHNLIREGDDIKLDLSDIQKVGDDCEMDDWGMENSELEIKESEKENQNMKTIKFKKLTIKNFRSTEEREVEFTETGLDLKGANGIGKTTVLDAITVLLYDRDYEFKTLKTGKWEPANYNGIIDGYISSLYLEFEIDGELNTISKEIKKGSGKNFLINGNVFKTKGEFDKVIEEMFGTQETFFTLMNAHYLFGLEESKARAEIVKLIPKIDDNSIIDEFAKGNENVEENFIKRIKEAGINQMLDNCSAKNKEFKTKIVNCEAEIKVLNSQQEEMKVTDLNYDELSSERDKVKSYIEKAQILTNERMAVIDKENKIVNEIRSIESQIAPTNEEINKLVSELNIISTENAQKINEYNLIKSGVNTPCGNCGHTQDKTEFENSKKQRMEVIVTKGKENRKEENKLEVKIDELTKSHKEVVKKFEIDKVAKIAELKEEVTKIVIPLKINIIELTNELNDINETLRNGDNIKRNEERLSKLNKELKKFQTAKVELDLGVENIKEILNKIALKTVEGLNAKIKEAGFKVELFNVQKNGSLKESFIVESAAKDIKLSKGEKIGATIAISKALQKMNGIVAPILMDDIKNYTGDYSHKGQVIRTMAE